MSLFVYLIIFLGVVSVLYSLYKIADDKEKQREREKMMDEKTRNTRPIIENVSDDEYKKQVLNMLNMINTNLLDQEMKMNKQNEQLNSIEFCIRFIAVVILIVIIVKVVFVIFVLGETGHTLGEIYKIFM